MPTLLNAQLMEHLLADLGLQEPPVAFPARDENFTKNYLAYNLLRKVEPFEKKSQVPVQVLKASLEKFQDAEFRCSVMNLHGRMYSCIVDEDQKYFSRVFELAKIWINQTLCDVWPRWDDVRYTGGASRHCSRRQSLAVLKWAGFAENGNLSGTAPAVAIVDDYIKGEYGPSWHGRPFEVVEDSRFDFVAKTFKTVRFMAMEPEYNMLVQSCAGQAIRAALKFQGINLDDQRPNQQMAFLGSIFRTRATLDLSSASDCVALILLKMLPARWVDLLLCARTPRTRVGSYSHKLQKVATMGNGFIFELQSLIFAAFAHACTELSGGRKCDIAVYGDDIIVSTPVAVPLMQTLEYFGLIPNLDKSYWDVDEPFRESCGKHWLAGRDVTPFYVKTPIGSLTTLFRAYNGLREWQDRTGIQLSRSLGFILDLIPKKERVVVPLTYSNDSGLHYPVKGCTFPKRVIRYGDIRYKFRCLVDVTQDVTDRLSDYVRYSAWLQEPYAELTERRFYPPTHMAGYPTELREYCRGPDGGTRQVVWADREVGPGDFA